MNNVVGLDRVNALCSRAASKEREHARSAADFQHHITLTDSPGDRVGISVETARVANHFSIRAEGIHISVWRARRWNYNRQISTLRRPESGRRDRRCALDQHAARSGARALA